MTWKSLSSWSCLLLSSAGHRWLGRTSSQDGTRQHAHPTVYVQPPHAAVQHSAGMCGGERGAAPSAYCAFMMVSPALWELYRRKCLYLTSHVSLGVRIRPPFRPACVIRTGLKIVLTNPRQGLCNLSLVQLPITSAPEPLPSMSSCDFEGGGGQWLCWLLVNFFFWICVMACCHFVPTRAAG